MRLLPDDYKTPEWDKAQRVHDWRNYISDEVRALWDSFTDEQKQAIARQADEQSDVEEWD